MKYTRLLPLKEGRTVLQSSTRSIAREWALKILYQCDAGNIPLEEALDPSLEILRMEFVQRGSRRASGSEIEYACMDVTTSTMKQTLSQMSAPLALGLAYSAAQLSNDYPYLLEVRLERSISRRYPSVLLKRYFNLESDRSMVPLTSVGLSTEEQATVLRLISLWRGRFVEYSETHLAKKSRELSKEWSDACTRHSTGATSEFLSTLHSEFCSAREQEVASAIPTIEKQVRLWLLTASYTKMLASEVHLRKETLDTLISEHAIGWPIDRQPPVDRNIMRIAVYEMIYCADVPAPAAINEAVELAKKFSSSESGKFVNGVLGAVLTALPLTTSNTETLHSLEDDIVDITVEPEIDSNEDENTESSLSQTL